MKMLKNGKEEIAGVEQIKKPGNTEFCVECNIRKSPPELERLKLRIIIAASYVVRVPVYGIFLQHYGNYNKTDTGSHQIKAALGKEVCLGCDLDNKPQLIHSPGVFCNTKCEGINVK